MVSSALQHNNCQNPLPDQTWSHFFRRPEKSESPAASPQLRPSISDEKPTLENCDYYYEYY